MNTNTNENGNSENPELDEVLELDVDETDVDVIKEHAQKVEDRNKQLYARVKKAEGFELVDGKWVKQPKPKTEIKPTETNTTVKEKLSQGDLIRIIKADVPEDKIDEILDYAKLKGITVAEALNAPLIKGILNEAVELRKVAEGTNTGSNKRGNAKVSDEALLQNAEKGIYPESDDEIARLIKIRRAKK